MSGYGAPDCGICGAVSDYCHLTTASGVEIDCRDLKLRDPNGLRGNIELAKQLQNTSEGCEG